MIRFTFILGDQFKLIFKTGLGKAVATVSSIVLLSIFSKYLDSSSFISLTIAQLIGYLAILFGNMGQNKVIYFINNERNTSQIDHIINITNSYKIIFTYGFFLCIILSIFFSYLISDDKLFILIYFLWIFSLSIQMFNGEHCRLVGSNWLSNLVGTSGGNNGAIGTLISLVFIIILLIIDFKLNLVNAVFSFLIGSLFANFIFFFFFLKKRFIRYFLAWNIKDFRLNTQFQLFIGIKGVFYSISVLILGQFDIFLATALCPKEDVSDYIIASNIAKLISIFGMLIVGAYPKEIAKEIRIFGTSGIAKFHFLKIMNIIVSTIAFISIIILLFTNIFENFFTIYSLKFNYILIILLIGHFFASFFLLGSLIFTITGNFNYLIFINIFLIIIGCLLSYLLNLYIGIYGISIAAAITIIFSQALSSYAYKRLA